MVEDALTKPFYSARGYGEVLENCCDMCHYLIGKGYSNIYNPFDIPIPMLITHYKYQLKAVKSDMNMEFTGQTLLTQLQNGDKEAVKHYRTYVEMLTRKDQIK